MKKLFLTILFLLLPIFSIAEEVQDLDKEQPFTSEPAAGSVPEQAAVAAEEKDASGLNRADFKLNVKLKGMNKITARVSSIDVAIGAAKEFGNLEILLETCWKSPPEEEPENKALLKIIEKIPGELEKEIFHGWMFSSHPALSVLEHPVYDISVIECF